MKKRQILGRGVRLAVDKYGKRVEDKEINRLTVVANESFDDFARGLQLEYEVSGISQGSRPNDIKKKKKAKRQYEEVELNNKFKALWKKLKSKTLFELKLDEEKYKEKVIQKLQEIETREQKIVRQFGTIEDGTYGYVAEEKSFGLNFEQILPNLVSVIEKEVGLTRAMIIEILDEVDLKPFIRNSDEYTKRALEAFDDSKHEILTESTDGIVYRESGEYYTFMNVFPDELEGYDLEECKRGLYDSEQWDSEIEKSFIECADTHFKFFAKLPKRFKIKTPLGNYTPDFAVIKLDESEGSFVVETKGSEKESELRGHEKWQIAYAKRHFKLLDIKYRDRVTGCDKL